MAQTYAQLQQQIEALQKQADKAKSTELAEVIGKIKIAIDAYGITSEQLFGAAAVKSTKAHKGSQVSKSKAKVDTTAQFADGTGNEWVGRGPRPKWLRDALASGKSLADFAVGTAVAMGSPVAAPVGAVAKKSQSTKTTSKNPVVAKKPGAPKYRDEAGNSWTGRGPQPHWLNAAVAAGKQLDDFRV